jgi:hypothetical protein
VSEALERLLAQIPDGPMKDALRDEDGTPTARDLEGWVQ